MTPAQESLARRAVACLRRQWRPGMVATDGWRHMGEHEVPAVVDGTDGGWIGDDTPQALPAMLPDLSDPATIGAIIALWQSSPGHVFVTPCPVLSNAAIFGLTDIRTVEALIVAMETEL